MVRSSRELDLDALRGTSRHKGKKRIGYGKLGRSINFNEAKYGFQGDAEAPNLLYRLARRNPDVLWIVVGRSEGEIPDGYDNIITPWASRQVGNAWGFSDKLSVYISTLDGMVIQHGQSGTSHHSIPQSDSTWADYYRDPLEHATTPQDWGAAYAGFLIRGINLLGDKTHGTAPVVWLVPDPRNYVKARDIKWPTGLDDILSQYTYTRTGRHERWQDARWDVKNWKQHSGYGVALTEDRGGEVWVAEHRYRSAGLELMILPDDWPFWGSAGYDERFEAGIATTSFAVDPAEKEPPRSKLVRDWLLATWPQGEVYGKWDDKSLTHVPRGTVRQTKPAEFPQLLNRWRVTLALPALGSSWTTAKPYQLWAARSVGFMVGRCDGQGFVLPTRRREEGVHQVGEVNGVKFYSVRDDWTQDDLVLASWLRVETPEEFAKVGTAAATSRDVWEWLTTAQRNLLGRRWEQAQVETEVERKLGLR